MATKQISGNHSADGGMYVCITDGASNLIATGGTMTTGATKASTGRGIMGSYAHDGSLYVTFTDGAGNLK